MGGYSRLDGTYLIRASSRGQPSDSERQRSALGVTLLAHQKAQTPEQKADTPRPACGLQKGYAEIKIITPSPSNPYMNYGVICDSQPTRWGHATIGVWRVAIPPRPPQKQKIYPSPHAKKAAQNGRQILKYAEYLLEYRKRMPPIGF